MCLIHLLWKGSPGTLKSWLTQEAGVGRSPQGTRGLLGPAGLLTLPGEDWSLPSMRPRNSYRRKSGGWTLENVREDLKKKTIGNYLDW